MIYTMFSYDTKVADDEIKKILEQYEKKHGKPPQILELNPDVPVDITKLPKGIAIANYPYVQKGLLYLGEDEIKEEE